LIQNAFAMENLACKFEQRLDTKDGVIDIEIGIAPVAQ